VLLAEASDGGSGGEEFGSMLASDVIVDRAAKVAAVRILDEQQLRFLAPLIPAERRQLAALLTRLHGQPAPGQ
jgi:hypothetical protein